MIKYQLTEDDLQLLYPLCTVEDICRLFPDHAPSHWTIRRRYKRLGLTPINSAYKSFRVTLLALDHETADEELWAATVDETLQEYLDHQVERIREKIRTVEARVEV